jgi:hypothetical protein
MSGERHNFERLLQRAHDLEQQRRVAIAIQGKSKQAPEAQKPSVLKRLQLWEGLSFVFLTSIAFTLLTLNEFDWARWWFIAAAAMGTIGLTNQVGPTQLKSRTAFAVMAAILAGMAATKVNTWVTEKEIAHNLEISGKTTVIVQKVAPPPVAKRQEHTHVEFAAPVFLNLGDWPSIGVAPEANLLYRNGGQYIVRNASLRGKLAVGPNSTSVQKALFAEFVRNANFAEGGPSIVPNGIPIYHSFRGPPVASIPDLDSLKAGTTVLYAVGAVRWDDDTGSYETDKCQYFDLNDHNWHFCSARLSDENKLKKRR